MPSSSCYLEPRAPPAITLEHCTLQSLKSSLLAHTQSRSCPAPTLQARVRTTRHTCTQKVHTHALVHTTLTHTHAHVHTRLTQSRAHTTYAHAHTCTTYIHYTRTDSWTDTRAQTHTRTLVLQKEHSLAWNTVASAAGGGPGSVMAMLCKGDAMDVLVYESNPRTGDEVRELRRKGGGLQRECA